MSKPLITRGQFVAGYVARAGLQNVKRTRAGFETDSLTWEAVRCNCGEAMCLGWAMKREPRPLAQMVPKAGGTEIRVAYVDEMAQRG